MNEDEEIDFLRAEAEFCSVINSCYKCDNTDCPKNPDSIYYEESVYDD